MRGSTTVLACVLFASPIAACATSDADTATGAKPDGATFNLGVGEQKRVDGGTLAYRRLVKDSRCPPDVNCVWAGDAVIELAWTPAGGATQPFELHTGLEPRSHAIGSRRRVVLDALARGPQPAATLKIEAAP
jgi:hypothetical protein